MPHAPGANWAFAPRDPRTQTSTCCRRRSPCSFVGSATWSRRFSLRRHGESDAFARVTVFFCGGGEVMGAFCGFKYNLL